MRRSGATDRGVGQGAGRSRRPGVVWAAFGLTGLWGVAAVGCHRSPAEPVVAAPIYRSAGVSVESGLLAAAVRIENPGNVAIRFTLAGGCHGGIITQLFTVGGAPATRLWSEDRDGAEGCKFGPNDITLEPGEGFEAVDRFETDAILGDSIPPGVYEVRAIIRQLSPEARDVPITLGDVDLGS